ncbi:hypothetical protein M9H77_25225 [Catharanthus roseus]|uniref:Uncharacterized protein n=1 Tax=Catharanthus roseus TaxID=4058 RepID=A0ACC0A8Z3_CATRO|nr:hypothetical protein M9H77_25225 [Catharanthus roseus]
MAPASGSDGHPRHGKGKGLTDSFTSVMSKISGSRNKRPNVAREVSAPTQRRKKVKASNWELTGPADRGPVDPELIPSYSGHVAGPIWWWDLTDAHVRPLASGTGLTHLRSCMNGNGVDGESGFTTDDKLDIPLLRPLPLPLSLRGSLPLPRGLGPEPEPEPLPDPDPEPLTFLSSYMRWTRIPSETYPFW